jgi:F-box domain
MMADNENQDAPEAQDEHNVYTLEKGSNLLEGSGTAWIMLNRGQRFQLVDSRETKEAERLGLSGLPEELLLNISELSSISDAIALAQVSRIWRRLLPDTKKFPIIKNQLREDNALPEPLRNFIKEFLELPYGEAPQRDRSIVNFLMESRRYDNIPGHLFDGMRGLVEIIHDGANKNRVTANLPGILCMVRSADITDERFSAVDADVTAMPAGADRDYATWMLRWMQSVNHTGAGFDAMHADAREMPPGAAKNRVTAELPWALCHVQLADITGARFDAVQADVRAMPPGADKNRATADLPGTLGQVRREEVTEARFDAVQADVEAMDEGDDKNRASTDLLDRLLLMGTAELGVVPAAGNLSDNQTGDVATISSAYSQQAPTPTEAAPAAPPTPPPAAQPQRAAGTPPVACFTPPKRVLQEAIARKQGSEGARSY